MPSAAISRPSAVARPAPSSASSRCSRSRACASGAAGGGSSHARVRRIETAPAGEFECERREIGLEDLRRRLRQQRRVLRLAPQSVADAGCRAPCATAALVGRRARDAHGLEPAHPGRRIEALASLEPGVDHDAHAVDREARLGDVGGEHDLAAATRVRSQRRILVLGRSGRRTAAARCSAPRATPSRAPRRRDGSRPRPAGTPARRPRAPRVRAGSGSPPAAPRRASVRPGRRRRDVHRSRRRTCGPGRARRPRRRAPGERFAVERGRHDEQAQVRAQVAPARRARARGRDHRAGCARGTRRT